MKTAKNKNKEIRVLIFIWKIGVLERKVKKIVENVMKESIQ